MRNETRNWVKINKRLLRLGDLSRYQRKQQDINIRHTQAWIKCEQCDKDLLVEKAGKDWNFKDKDLDNKEWEAFRRKATVKKDEAGYYIITRIEFYCPSCQPLARG